MSTPDEPALEAEAEEEEPDHGLGDPIPLNEAEQIDMDRAVEWLQENWSARGKAGAFCAVCGGETWKVGGPVAIPAFRRGPLSGAVIAAFPVTCATCGQMLLLNATVPENLLAPVEDDSAEDGVSS
jgi:hypothetical protein